MAKLKGKAEEQPVISQSTETKNVKVVDKVVLVPGGRANENNEKVIVIKDEAEVIALSLSGKLTGYNPITGEARIKID